MKRLTLFLLLFGLPTPQVWADDAALNLPLGDPARREREAPLLLDAITDTRNGDTLAPVELAARLAGVRLLFVGENHTNQEFHQAQLRIVQELARSGRQVLIGLEMYPTWSRRTRPLGRGRSDRKVFLVGPRWYKNWATTGTTTATSSSARDQAPHVRGQYAREVVSAVRKKGFLT